MHRPETLLEPALTRSLARVEAPRELLDRVLFPAASQPNGSRAWWILAPALALVILVVALALGLHADEGNGLAASQAFAVRALTRGPEHLAFRSGEPSRIRAWIQASTALEIPLSAQPAVQLLGANAGGPAAEIAYRIENHNAVLLISKAESGFPGSQRHQFLPGERYNGTRVSSWVMRGQLYTLAFASAGDFESACRLCHAGEDWRTTLN